MPTANLTIANSWWGRGDEDTWRNSSDSQIWAGRTSGTNYRSKIRISTAGLDFAKSSKLVVKFKLNQESYPAGVSGVLSTLNSTTPQIQGSGGIGMSSALAADHIATSDTYLDEEGTTKCSNKWYSSGKVFYLVFNTEDLEPDTIYYVYLIRSSTSDSWTSSDRDLVTVTLDYVVDYYVHICNGDTYEDYVAYIHDGTEFAKYYPYIHNGTDWERYT